MSIFSPEIVSSFYKNNRNRIPVNNQFNWRLSENIAIDNIYHKKSTAYFICGEFEKDCEYTERANDLGDNLFVSLLVYADNNFRNRCLLRDAAVSIGYDYAYVSKFFKNKARMSFRQYVNCLRIIESKQLLKSTSKSISEISEVCGFSSTRIFDREFHSQIGMTPSDYKKCLTSGLI
jgi:YesN/AraC family two-component response regulator